MKVIFLDIDGVLNVCYPEYDGYGSLFHPEFVKSLEDIIIATDAKLVISSSWRYSGLDKMRAMWKDRNLPGEIIDITPDGWILYKQGLIPQDYDRGHEIKYWLEHNEVENYVIIDDDTDMLSEQLSHFVRTANNRHHKNSVDLGYGLTEECAIKAIKILNND